MLLNKYKGMPTEKGFTLMELMIVIAIVAILLGVALPSYQNAVLKSNRNAGRGILLDVASRQEQYFINNKAYTDDLTDLGYTSETFYVDNQVGKYNASSGSTVYKIDLSIDLSLAAPIYTLTATPDGRQTKDTRCGTLSITSLGVKGETGTQSVAECW